MFVKWALQIVRRLLAPLNPSEKKHFWKVLTVATFGAALQVASVASVIQFVALIMRPDELFQASYFILFKSIFALESARELALLFGAITLLILFLSNVILASSAWYTAWVEWSVQTRLSTSLLLSYLQKPYSYLAKTNSSKLVKNVVAESAQYTRGMLTPLVMLLSKSINIAMLLGFLCWLRPSTTLIISLVFGAAYWITYKLVKGRLKRLGKLRLMYNARRFKAAQEAFGSPKEVKLLGCESVFAHRFESDARGFGDTIVQQSITNTIPRYAIEIVAFGLMLSVMLVMLYRGVAITPELGVIAGFALGGYRVMTAFQGVYSALNSLRVNQPALELIQAALVTDCLRNSSDYKLEFKDFLKLENASFHYENSETLALKNINIKLPRTGLISFVGTTGAGKTTLIDIILGLLDLQQGHLSVDDKIIDSTNRRMWQNNIGYVPQSIYLLDSDVSSNIAFGVTPEKIDMEVVERVARTARIHDFIVGRLEKGYQTVVGERGARLSGGERQRIGIARALYRDPDVLILDEATSALDGATEAEVHAAVLGAARSKLVIVVAHRLSTVEASDKIYVMEHGEILAQGTHAQLLQSSAQFRRLAQLHDDNPGRRDSFADHAPSAI